MYCFMQGLNSEHVCTKVIIKLIHSMDGVKIDNREDKEDISDDEEDSNNNIMLEGLQEGSGPSLDN